MLARKLLRDLLQKRWQAVAVTLVMLLGIALFDGSYMAYQSLSESYTATQDRTHLAAMTLDLAGITPDQVQQVQALPDVERAESRLVMPTPVRLPEGKQPGGIRGAVRLDGRLIGIPVGEQPALNQVVVVAGRYPASETEVLVEQHLADHHGLVPGSHLWLESPGGDQQVQVAGVAVSAEYLWVARDRQDVMPSPSEFGVLFVPRPLLQRLGERGLAAAGGDPGRAPFLALLQIAATQGAGNQLLYSPKPAADGGVLQQRVAGLLQPGQILAVTPRAKLVGVELLQMDLDGLREMAFAFPLFFLTVAAFIVLMLLNRQVEQERPLIGTLMAVGVGRGQVLRHYLALSLLLGGVAALLGTGLGLLMGSALAETYAAQMKIPFVTVTIDPLVLLGGALMGMLVAALAGIFPARSAAACPPAIAMRPFSAAASVHAEGARLGRLPLWLRLPMRTLLRRPWRTLGTASGVSAALVLVIATAGIIDSFTRGIDLAFTRAERYDLRADFYLPQPAAEKAAEVEHIPGVKQVEVAITLPVRAESAGGRTYSTLLRGLSPDGELITDIDQSGRPVRPGANEAVLTASVARQLGVGVGDAISLRVLPDGPSISVRIGALSDIVAGNSISMRLADAGAAFGLEGQANTLLLTVEPAQRRAVVKALNELTGTLRVSDLQDLREQIDALMGMSLLMLGAMLLLAVILAGAILFNTTTLAILEQSREFATMRALGVGIRQIGWLVTAQNGLIALLGLLVGLPLSLITLHQFLQLFSSDLFSINFWLYPRTIMLAVGGTLLMILLVQRPALRQVAATNLAEATRARE